MTWEAIDAFFNRLEAAAAREWARLARLEDDYEEMMQDYVGRPLTQTVEASELGKFTQRTEALATMERTARRGRADGSMGERTFEVESMRAAEELRKSFIPAKPKKGTTGHVRDPRPIPAALAAKAMRLGVTL